MRGLKRNFTIGMLGFAAMLPAPSEAQTYNIIAQIAATTGITRQWTLTVKNAGPTIPTGSQVQIIDRLVSPMVLTGAQFGAAWRCLRPNGNWLNGPYNSSSLNIPAPFELRCFYKLAAPAPINSQVSMLIRTTGALPPGQQNCLRVTLYLPTTSGQLGNPEPETNTQDNMACMP